MSDNKLNFSDRELYRKCIVYGRQALKARRKFIGLLPEVFKRKLYAKKGFDSISEFASKLAGISHDQVNKILQLERKYEDKPVLHAALVEGKISVNKLIRVASINYNQEELVKKVEILSSRALEVFVREVKQEARNEFGCAAENEIKSGVAKEVENDHQDGSIRPLFEVKTVHVHCLKLDENIENELIEMQEKGIDVNSFLRKCLEQRKQQIEQEKERMSQEVEQERSDKNMIGMPTSRYIPAKIKKIIKEEHGTKCSRQGCNNPSKPIHHEKHFSEAQIHDPRFLKPLCKAHHELKHADDTDYQKFRQIAFK